MTNKRALVTGGNRGIALAIAQGLINLDYEVIITARSIESAKKAAEKLGKKAIPLELDVSDDNSIDRAIPLLSQKIDCE
jgi:NAD(P)-dependent dehydrogenase (short-subunit alcohol dehydrogenase family)